MNTSLLIGLNGIIVAFILAINDVKPHNWYGVAKLHAEFRHRSMPHLSIIDLRVFNYFSQFSDINARFLVTDILRTIKDRNILRTSRENIVRDYMGPMEFLQLTQKILQAPPRNAAIECYTREPIDKFTLLDCMRENFDLKYLLVDEPTGLQATGTKLQYYSKNRVAEDLFGYFPESTSLDVVLEQSRLLLSNP
jgi:nucleoside-diphosphate-sugar epimerase